MTAPKRGQLWSFRSATSLTFCSLSSIAHFNQGPWVTVQAGLKCKVWAQGASAENCSESVSFWGMMSGTL